MKLNASNISIIKRLLSSRNSKPLQSILNKIEAADLSTLFGLFDQREKRLLLESLMSIDKAAPTLVELPSSQIPEYLSLITNEKIIQICSACMEEHAAHILLQLGHDSYENILNQIPSQKRAKIRQIMNYPEESAGRMMQTHVFKIPSHLTTGEGLDLLRQKAQEESIYYIYCVNKNNQLEGVISLRSMAIALTETPLKKLIKSEIITVSPKNTAEEVAKIVSHYDFIAIPVIDENQQLLGIISIDDVLEVVQEQATSDIYAHAGLQEDDRVYSSALYKIKNRAPWMFLNLVLAALASGVLSAFEVTMHQLIALATFKNIVAGLSGNTAIQSLTVVTRGLAVGDFNYTTQTKVLIRETAVGATLGVIVGIAAGILTYVWKENILVSSIIFISLVFTSILASFIGSAIPILMDRFNLDPAVGSGVIVTMITDIFSFISFLGLASLGLKYLG